MKTPAKGGTVLETRTGFLISQIKLAQRRVFQRLLQANGVEEFNGPQGSILYVLWQEDGIPIVELVRQTGLAKNTLTAMLERMERSGLVCRNPGAKDRRKTLICLTDRARGLEERYNQVSQQMNRLFFEGFSAGEMGELEGYLDRIVENLRRAEKTIQDEKKGGSYDN